MGFTPDQSDDSDIFHPDFDKLVAKMMEHGNGDANGIDSELDASGFRSRHQRILAEHSFVDEENPADDESDSEAPLPSKEASHSLPKRYYFYVVDYRVHDQLFT